MSINYFMTKIFIYFTKRCKRDEECCDLDCCPKSYSTAQILNNPNYNYIRGGETRSFTATVNFGNTLQLNFYQFVLKLFVEINFVYYSIILFS